MHGRNAVNVRAYTLSAIAVTASAVAGLWFGVLLAHGHADVTEPVPRSHPGRAERAVTSVTPAPAVLADTHDG